jgi:hypothetical protein
MIKVHYLDEWSRFKHVLAKERWMITTEDFESIEKEYGIEKITDMEKITN